MFGKEFPFAYLVIAFYGLDKIKQEFNINDKNEYIGSEEILDKFNFNMNAIIIPKNIPK